MSDLRQPDGIESRHVHAGGTWLHAWSTGRLLLTLAFVVASFDVFGSRAAAGERPQHAGNGGDRGAT